jgi:putative aldouronate transport system permease protein
MMPVATVISRAAKTRLFFKRLGKQRALLLMFIPAIAYYIVFCYTPIYGLVIAFKDYKIVKGFMGSSWVGVKQFQTAFGDPEFFAVFRNTLMISAYKLAIGFPAPILLALLLNEIGNLRFKKVVQTISYLPHFISWVVLGGITINLLSPSTGVVNRIIMALGGKPVYFIASLRWFRTVLVATNIWKGIGWGSIVYIAAIGGVDTELYEAAALDGAGRLKQVVHVVIPSIAPVIVIMLIFAVGGIVNDDFDQVFNLYNPTVYSVGDVLSTYTYRQGLERIRYSYSTAVGLFRNVISFALVVATNAIAKHFSEYGLW